MQMRYAFSAKLPDAAVLAAFCSGQDANSRFGLTAFWIRLIAERNRL